MNLGTNRLRTGTMQDFFFFFNLSIKGKLSWFKIARQDFKGGNGQKCQIQYKQKSRRRRKNTGKENHWYSSVEQYRNLTAEV